MWNEIFELPDRLYSVSDIQDYFKYIIIKHEAVTDNLPIRIYVNQIVPPLEITVAVLVHCNIASNSYQ